MIELNNEHLSSIKGGGFNLGIILGVGALVVFIIGILDGYTNPTKCNNNT